MIAVVIRGGLSQVNPIWKPSYQKHCRPLAFSVWWISPLITTFVSEHSWKVQLRTNNINMIVTLWKFDWQNYCSVHCLCPASSLSLALLTYLLFVSYFIVLAHAVVYTTAHATWTHRPTVSAVNLCTVLSVLFDFFSFTLLIICSPTNFLLTTLSCN